MNFSINRGLPLISILWCLVLLAAFTAAYFKGVDTVALLPLAGIAVAPALIGLVLWPFSRHEWVQMLVIFSWISLAIIACFAIAFVPMAVLFLCAPAAAALFEREKVIEAMVLAAIFAAGVFYFGQLGYAPEPIASAAQASFGELAGIMATIAFMVGAMYFSASKRSDAGQIGVDIGVAENAKEGFGTVTNIKNSNTATLKTATQFARAYPGAVLKFDADGALEMASPLAQVMLGIDSENKNQISLSSLALDERQERELGAAFDNIEDMVDEQIDNDYISTQSINIDIPEQFQSGSGDRLVYSGFTLVPQADGCVFAFTSDCTRIGSQVQSAADAQLSAKNEFEEKTLFFAGVSHELRTPLNAIIGFSDMMRSRLFGPLPGKYAEYADLIHDSGQHMLDLVGDVLDMSKVEANKYKLSYCEFDAADVVRSSLKMVRPSADAAELELDADIQADADLVVEADRRAVRQILLNLLSNAIKFTPKGGRVTAYASKTGRQLELIVEDTGTGMTAKDIETLGTPYKQTSNANMIKDRGTGLGLSLVKNLVELHSGEFSVTSHPGVGTTVTVTLPLTKPTPK